jgi:hypothetical protein
VLRFDRDVRGSMQYPHDRPQGDSLRSSSIADDPAEQGSAPATLCRCVDQFVNRAMASRSAESPNSTRSSSPRSRATASRVLEAVVSRMPDPNSDGTREGWRLTSRPARWGHGSPLTESGEDRMRDRLWQPPTPKLSRGEVGKGRLGGKHQYPRSEPVSQSARLAILDIEAV